MQEPGKTPIILGVKFDLESMEVSITEDRRKALLEEIKEILRVDRLGAGQAAKLKGKLNFVSSQFLGRCGRAALRALSERQYSVDPDTRLTRVRREKTTRGPRGPKKAKTSEEEEDPDTPAKKALLLWQAILKEGSARPIPQRIGGPADAIICTDGFFPDPVDVGKKPPRVGGVMFARWRSKAVCFSSIVTRRIMEKWMPRKTQIAQVELLAIVAAIETFGAELAHKRVVVLVDSESALGAAIKGYSTKQDISDLVTRLWETIARHRMIVYFDRISTDANISDGPSRNDWEVAKTATWATQRIELD